MSGGDGSFNRRLFKRGFQLRLDSRKSSCLANVCWKGVPDKWCLILKGSLTEGFSADSWYSKEFLINRPEKTRGLINFEQR